MIEHLRAHDPVNATFVAGRHPTRTKKIRGRDATRGLWWVAGTGWELV